MDNVKNKSAVPLTPDEVSKGTAELNGWEISQGKLRREFKFKNFAEALAFTNEVAALAEAANHHPDLYLSWGRVVVELWTHSAKGLTAKDFSLAKGVGSLF